MIGRLAAGAGGTLLIVSLFMPWADAGGAEATGWELLTIGDVLFLIVGVYALGTALSGGRFGVFRPDVSLHGATDMLSVLSTLLIVWLVAFDFPEGADRKLGVFLALIAAATIAGGTGDYRVLRKDAVVFPPTDTPGGPAPTER